MRTLISKIIKNKTPKIKKRKRYCLDQKFNKELARYRRRQKTGIILFLVTVLIGIITVLVLAIGSIFGIAAV